MEEQKRYDVIIIGAGPAGLTAAIYLLRAGHSTLVLEESMYGGQMANTPEVENYPAVTRISGAELSQNLYNHALEQGAIVEFDGVVSAVLAGKGKRIETLSGKTYLAHAIIIANGARRRKLEIPGEETYLGRGVSYCATCDGGFFKNKVTTVIGGGNTALEDALYLANICERVHLLHRRDSFRGSKVLADSVLSNKKITVHYDTVPMEILPNEAKNAVGAIFTKNIKSGETQTLSTSAVFVAVGLAPDNSLFSEAVKLDKQGYIIAGEDTKTSQPGVFAAGDTRTKSLRQIITAAGDGAVAAFEAGNYIHTLGN